MKVSLIAILVLGAAVGAQEKNAARVAPLAEPVKGDATAVGDGAKGVETGEFSPDWIVHWEVQAMTLAAGSARPLLGELRDETTSAAGWKKIEALVEKKEAEAAFETGGQVVDDWTGAEFARVEEVRYPAENERPEVVGPVQTSEQPGLSPRQDFSAPKPVRFPIPKFDTRKVGYIVSVDAAVSPDGKRLMFGVEVEHTWLLQWDEFEVGRLANNEKIIFKQPRFAAVRRTGKIPLFSGERALLSAQEVPGAVGKTELIFLHAWTTPRKKGEAK